MQDLGRTAPKEGSFIVGDIRLLRMDFFLPFQPSGSNLAYWTDYMAIPHFWSRSFAGFGKSLEADLKL